MAFITGLALIDAPASALNNGEGVDTKSKVKSIRVQGDEYPYVSAQSFRYWLRQTMHKCSPELEASPVYSAGKGKKQQAYTEGNPITYWDDDLLGYMRAEKGETVTRVSPVRTGTLVSIAPTYVTDDFGVMARVKKEEGDKEGVLLHGHEFYRTTLQLLFSIDLNRVGTFTNQRRTGYQNLGKEVEKQAQEDKLAYSEELLEYRLPVDLRIKRVQALLQAMARLEGGANQTLHYTDVSPAFAIASITTGGNHIFGRAITTTKKGKPAIHRPSIEQIQSVFKDDMLSPIYVGRAEGFMDDSLTALQDLNLESVHPRSMFDTLAADLAKHPEWME